MTTRHRHSLAAFTLIELMVAVSLLTVIILSIGVVFKSTGNAVGLGEATGDMFSKVRAINQQLASDVHGIDRNAFLIIRCQAEAVGDLDVDPGVTNIKNTQRFRRYDQISFISIGKFPNRTGSTASGSTSVFADNSSANAARIWYGQLFVQKDRTTPAPQDETTAMPTARANNNGILGFIPNSLIGPRSPSPFQDYPSWPLDPSYESGFILGRQAMLLLNPPATVTVPGYATITSNATIYSGANPPAGEPNAPLITSSRVGVAYTTTPQIMTDPAFTNGAGGGPTSGIFASYCYRLKTLPSPTTTGVSTGGSPNLSNGVFRMHPIFAQGVPSFAVDWTDGTLDTNGNLQWYGYNAGSTNYYADDATVTASFPAQGHSPYYIATAVTGRMEYASGQGGGEKYDVVFSPVNAKLWPKALRFTYRITDANDRLNGGRTFVCVVDLPPATH